MASLCPICRRIVPPGTGTLLKAGRKSLAYVHPQCAAVAQHGVGLLGRLALKAGELVLAARAPGVAAALNTVRQVLHKQRGAIDG